METIRATEIAAPPGWALLQRELIRSAGEGAALWAEKYMDPAGVVFWTDDVDDLYERFHNWGLFYAIGAEKRVFEIALQGWHATTRFFDEGVVNRIHPRFKPQIHKEYYNLAVPGGAEWHHKSEGNVAFYEFGLADPTISENVRRARRFAAFYMDEDPEAPNYDPRYRIFRSPIQSSRGPYLEATVDNVKSWLDPIYYGNSVYKGQPRGIARRSSLYPIVGDLEPEWYENPERAKEILALFDRMVLNGDVANSLAATALITNAYLYTGEEKYRKWVLGYVDGWMDRMRRNNGIMPDNVGPTGKIGEQRDGQWWGGLYGWNSRFSGDIMFHSLTVAAECALLVSGDYGYLDLLRSQLDLLLGMSETRADGQLVAPHRHGPNGWEEFRQMRIREFAHLWHASMDPGDFERIERLRDGDRERDWNQVGSGGDGRGGESEYSRFQYYDNKNPDWPEKIMRAELNYVLTSTEGMRRDSRDVDTILAENRCPPNPVVTKGLTQVTMGAPKTVYNGGLLQARVRYFDPAADRPGLPEDVAALVEKLEAERIVVRFINLSKTQTRKLIVQAGAFGEHRFTEVRFEEIEGDREGGDPAGWTRATRTRKEKTVSVDGVHLAVELPRTTSIRIDIGMRRFVNKPSYAFPWHGGKLPVPFQVTK